MIKDVTNKPKREPPTGVPMPRAEVIAGQVARWNTPGNVAPIEEILDTVYCHAFNAGMAAGRAERGTNT